MTTTTSDTTAQAGAQITRDGDEWNATMGNALSITWAFRLSASTADSDGVDGDGATFQQFSTAQMIAAQRSIQAWSDVANISFTHEGTGTSGPGAYSDSATILLGNYTSSTGDVAAYGFLPATRDASTGSFEGDVWIDSALAENNGSSSVTVFQHAVHGLDVGGYGSQTLTHEIGHALGLQHPGDYDASDGHIANYADDALYIQDDRQYTVMSYFSETNTGADFHGLYAQGPLMDDIAAIQRLYGANTTAFHDDTTYGFNSNTGRDYLTASAANPFVIFCAYDTGGNDTFDFSGFTPDQKIDLNSGPDHFSSVGGMLGNVSIYDGVVIENAFGGAGADLIIGNDVANHLVGNDGNDSLVGGDGVDTLEGGAGNDTLEGDAGSNSLMGGAGDDTYYFGQTDFITDTSGNDTIIVLTASFGASSISVTNDHLVGIENITASGSGDMAINGDDNVNVLTGSDGANVIDGAGGSDVLSGGMGNDVLGGGAANDALHGGGGDDTLDGGAGADAMQGDAGNDTYVFDGTDNIVDSSGNDTVVVDTATFGFGSLSVSNGNFSGIENLRAVGTGEIDLAGDAQSNRLEGSDGVNHITGGDGADFLDGALGDDILDGGAGADTLFGGANDADSLLGGVGDDSLDGGSGADTLDAGTGTDTLVGGDGDDHLVFHGGSGTASGGQGADVLTVDLTGFAVTATSTGFSWSGGSIAYSGIETFDITAASITGELVASDGSTSIFVNDIHHIVTVSGGAEADILVVNYGAASEGLNSLVGQDVLRSAGNNFGVNYSGIERFNITTGSGNDSIVTGTGADTVRSGAGDDYVDTGTGAAVVDGGSGTDHWRADLSAATTAATLNLNNAGVQSFLGGSVAGIESIDLKTGSGADTITTLTGASHLFNDVISTGGGNDTVTVGGGSDVIDMGAGSDTLIVDFSWLTQAIFTADEGSGPLILRSGGNDIRAAYTGVETFNITTGTGADHIITGAGNDTISTGLGDDIIEAGGGANVLTAGAGVDLLVADYGTSSTAVKLDLNSAAVQNFFGGTVQGFDEVQLVTGSGADSIVTLTGQASFETDTIDAGAGNDTITGGGSGRDTFVMGAGVDTLILDYSWTTVSMTTNDEGGGNSAVRSGGNDIRTGYSGVEIFNITTGSGNDFIITGDGNDTVSTGAGDDTISAGGGVNILTGGAGTDVLIADYHTSATALHLDLTSSAVQSFFGGTVQGFEWVHLSTGSGADSIVTLVGATVPLADIIDTGAGNDTITAGSLGNDSFTMGEEIDTLNLDYSWMTLGLSTNDESGGNFAIRTGGNDIRTGYSGVEIFNIETGSGGDSIATGDGDDTISTGAGDDTISAGGGINILTAGTGTDLLIADYHTSSAAVHLDLTSSAAQAFFGGTVQGFEWVRLATGSGADSIVTLVGKGVLLADTIDSGAGNDTITAGSLGNDSFTMGAGTDTLNLDYSWMTQALFTSDEGGGNFSIRTGGNDIRTGYSGVEIFNIRTGSGSDSIITGAGADTISTGLGDDTINSGSGLDVIDGGKGVDLWIANEHASKLDGVIDLANASNTFLGVSVKNIEVLGLTSGSGDDLIRTLAGPFSSFNDTIDAGAGNDTIFAGGGQDHIDGGKGQNTLIAYFGWTPDAMTMSGSTISNGARTLTIDFAHITHFDVTGGSGDDILIGGASDDTLTGGGGADTLSGGKGKGRDLFVYANWQDSMVDHSDLITDFGKGDHVDLSQIDAITKTAKVNDAFKLVAKFTHHAGELIAVYDKTTHQTSVSGDLDGDGVANFTILMDGDHHTAATFIL